MILIKNPRESLGTPGDFRKYYYFYYLKEIPKPVETILYWALV